MDGQRDKKTLLAHLTHGQRKSSTQAPHKVIKRTDNKPSSSSTIKELITQISHMSIGCLVGFDICRVCFVLGAWWVLICSFVLFCFVLGACGF